MGIENAGSSEQGFFESRMVLIALRLKWFLLPIVGGVLVAGIGVVVGGQLGAILVAYSVILLVLGSVGLAGISLIKAVERRG